MRYDLVIFDLDGTLADSFAFFVRAQRRLAARHGFRPVETGELERLRGFSPRQLLQHTGLARWKLPWVARSFLRLVHEEGESIKLFPGIDSVLHGLHASGVKLALVTSNSSENARRVLGESLWRCFSHVECGASVFGKRRRIARTLAATGTRAVRALYVGDQATDEEAARAAGVAFGAAGWGYASPESLRALQPEAQFAHVEELRLLAGAATPFTDEGSSVSPLTSPGASQAPTPAIRPARIEDAPELYAMMQALARHDGAVGALRMDLPGLERTGFGAKPRFHALLAEADGRSIGYVSYTVVHSIWAGRSCIAVDDLYVDPAYRRTGAGCRLMLALRTICVRDEHAFLRWTAELHNAPAIAFYERLGASVQAKGVFTWTP